MKVVSDGFDPAINAAVATSWYQLGKLLSIVKFSDDSEKLERALSQWIRKLEIDENLHLNVAPGTLSPSKLKAFARTVYEVLEKLFTGCDVSKKVRALTKAAATVSIRSDGQYLRFFESSDAFWAADYDIVFSEVTRPQTDAHKGWLEVASRCELDGCEVFFIRARGDQNYHSERCRLRAANRKAYNKRTGGRRKRAHRGGSL